MRVNMSNLRFYLSLFLSLRIKKQIPQRLLQGFSSILSVDFRSDSQTLFLAESLVLVSLEVFFFPPPWTIALQMGFRYAVSVYKNYEKVSFWRTTEEVAVILWKDLGETNVIFIWNFRAQSLPITIAYTLWAIH